MVQVNTGFCVLALCQSCVCIMLENKEDETIFPMWMNVLFKRFQLFIGRGNSFLLLVKKAAKARADGSLDPAASLDLLSNKRALNESVAGVLYRQTGEVVSVEKIVSRSRESIRNASPDELAERLLNFEQLWLPTTCSA